MKVFINDVQKHIYIDNLDLSLDTCVKEFLDLSKVEGSFLGIKDCNNKIIQFYYLQSDKLLADIPNPPSFINYQAWVNPEETIKMIYKIYEKQKVMLFPDMVKIDIKNSTLDEYYNR